MKPHGNKSALKMGKQTITKLNSKAMNQVNGAGELPTIGSDLSAIEFNCYSSCIPSFNGGVYCNPTIPLEVVA